jgi:hypothetical protein
MGRGLTLKDGIGTNQAAKEAKERSRARMKFFMVILRLGVRGLSWKQDRFQAAAAARARSRVTRKVGRLTVGFAERTSCSAERTGVVILIVLTLLVVRVNMVRLHLVVLG